MTPPLSAAARAAGPRLTDEARTSKPARWICSIPGCGAEGVEQTRRGRARALDHHFMNFHYRDGES